MPRVDDKTDAFFRRLIIIRLNKCFSEVEQNKNLKFELIQELDGILCWSLEGLRRLKERGHFDLPKSVQNEIEEYKKDNNNVLLFVEDMCQLKSKDTITKGYLYIAYSDWCIKNGYRPIGKKRFGNALTRHFNSVGEDKTNEGWIWTGLALNDNYNLNYT
jgi:putative DNA primase/helicase